MELPLKPLYLQEGCTLTESASPPTSESDRNEWFIYYALAATIVFTVGVFLFEAILDFRQRSCYKKTEFPTTLKTVISKIDEDLIKQGLVQEGESNNNSETNGDDTSNKKQQKLFLPQLEAKFTKSQTYGYDKVAFSIFSSTYDTAETVLFLLLGFLPYIWDTAESIGQNGKLGFKVEGEIGISLIFMALVSLIGTVTSLPFELYSTFHIEKKHGFNKQTYGLFFTDKIKGIILSFVIGGPFVSLLLYIIKWGGPYFYIYTWAFLFVFSVFMMTIVPVVIMPIFNKYEPLPDSELKNRIYALADQLKYPLKKLFVMDGSKRSSHSNAFMFGFGSNKRIVLFDTLMEQVHDEEILAILGHELGHWKLKHTMTNFLFTQFYFAAAFYCFSLCYTSTGLYTAFGFHGDNVPTLISLLLFFQTIWAPLDKVISFGLTSFSRVCEFAADRFSSDLGMTKDLQTGLCKIHMENLGAMCPDHLYSMYHYSHPPLVERLSAMMELEKKQK